jgi:hypothetical protein
MRAHEERTDRPASGRRAGYRFAMMGPATAADHDHQQDSNRGAGFWRIGAWGSPRHRWMAGAAAMLIVSAGAWERAGAQDAVPQPAVQPTPDGTKPSATPATDEKLAVTSQEDVREEREVELLLKNSQRISGVLIDANKDAFIVRISGVSTSFATSDVAKVTQLPTVEERYAAIRTATADDDTDGLMRLARWLLERKRYTLAMRETERVLELEPNNGAAKDLKKLLQEQQKLMAITRERAKAKAGESADLEAEPVPLPVPDAAQDPSLPVRPQTSTQRKRADFPLLTADQINMMRVYETDLKDPPTMFVTRGTVEKFLDKYAGTIVEGRGVVPTSPEAREKFLRQSAADVLSWFFDLRAREFYGEVEVKSDPKSMTNFREDVHSTWLINSCATTQCHGGQEAGRFYLYNREKNTTRASYTNFFILETYRTLGGGALIDYQNPARSPLLQMGLPRDKAVVRHPEVGQPGRRWKPVFDSPDDPKFRRAVEWIVSMYPNRSKYPIEYTPPVPTPLQGKSGAGVRPGGNQVPGAPEPTGPEKAPDPMEKPPQPR